MVAMNAPKEVSADRLEDKHAGMYGDLDIQEVFGEKPEGCWGATCYRMRMAGCGFEFVDKKAAAEGDTESQVDDKDKDVFIHPFSLRKRIWITALFTLLAALIMADQNALAPNLSDAAEFFGFDDVEKDVYLGGYIAAAFFGIGAPAGLLVGYLADKVNRKNLLCVVAILGNIPLMFMMLVTNYWHFFVIRILTGISVGGTFPLIYSLLGDMFPISQRAFVSSFITIATGGGVFLGQQIAAWVGPATDWRLPFVIVGAPAIAVAVLVFFTTEEPPRGAAEESLRAREEGEEAVVYNERITWQKIKLLLQIPSNWLIVLQGLPGSLPWGMFFVYFNDYLQVEQGFSTGVSTTIITVFGVGAAIGVVGGGLLGQWLFNRRKEWLAWLAGITTILGLGPGFFMINADLDSMLAATLVVGFFGGLLTSISSPNLRAALLNVNYPELRGVAFALLSMTDDLGKAIGPLMVAGAISGLGRQTAFNIAVSLWAVAGALMIGLVFCLRTDEAAVQRRLAELADGADGDGSDAPLYMDGNFKKKNKVAPAPSDMDASASSNTSGGASFEFEEPCASAGSARRNQVLPSPR